MPRDDTQAIKAALLADLPKLLQTLFPGRKLTRGLGAWCWRIGTHGSLAVRVDGVWSDKEGGGGGDILDLIAFALATDFKGALAFAKSYVGGAAVIAPRQSFPNFRQAQDASRRKQSARAKALWLQAQAPVNGGVHGTR